MNLRHTVGIAILAGLTLVTASPALQLYPKQEETPVPPPPPIFECFGDKGLDEKSCCATPFGTVCAVVPKGAAC
ncbi:hypothetical protein FA13DRAFT_1737931 [Coprinellus micaceus]|uniref:Uncharacterized protein n=1 Tax=Coprinellus micaceus TaxID=71717 RepID=A0A4Y7SVQ3_COPMI|nr:hypothetical protein FA13DRAFT_1737931 [Coprinellus micaceus]